MAHFAQLNEDDQVTQVIVINNTELLDENGQESEALGIAFCTSLFPGTRWVQTSYNASIRKNFAGQEFTYDASRDAFIPPRPFASWILDEATCRWQPPVAYPTDGKQYRWNEPTQSWQEITQG